MAGDWIPIRTGLEDEPEVVRIVGALCAPSGRNLRERAPTTTLVLGALQRTWSLFDRYSDDGILVGYTEEWLDATVGIEGWCANLQHVGWMRIEPQALVMEGFETWLGNSSKRRLSENKRKAQYKGKVGRKKRPNGAQTGREKRPTEEKRREENIYIATATTASNSHSLASPTGGDGLEAAAAVLSKLGVSSVSKILDTLTERKVPPEEVSRIIKYWNGNRASYDVGALVWRLTNAYPGAAADGGWPKPKQPEPVSKPKRPDFEAWRAAAVKRIGPENMDEDAEQAIVEQYAIEFG